MFAHFLNLIGNMSKHLAANVIGTVFGLRGKSGECYVKEAKRKMCRSTGQCQVMIQATEK